MWDDFHEAFVHGRHRILGRELKPYCAYHHLWLNVIGSPLLRGGPISLLDLDVATRICSCPYGDAEKALRPRWYDRAYFFARQLRSNVPDLCRLFAEYVEDYNSPPKRKSGGGTVISTSRSEMLPYPIWVVSGLMTVFHMTPEQAWMMPIGEAEWYLASADMHRDKECQILNGHDREFMAGIEQLRKAKEVQDGK